MLEVNNLQTDKQTPVSLPEICAPRSGLLQKFDMASKNQYVYIHAPAGFGKTISTLLWLKKRGMRTAWISLDAYDNTPVLFYRLFCQSLATVLAENTEAAQGTRSPAFNASPVESTIELLSQAAYESEECALVLDDLHTITNEEILKSLPYVIRRLPRSITVLMLSRNSLPAPFAALNEQGRISFIGSSELAFSSTEIRKHFANYGRFITELEAEKIYDYTEGWVIALNTIAVSGNIDMSCEGQAMSIGRFIEENIWNKLDAGLCDFLMLTSIPDTFSLELCEYLTESEKCRQNLNTLLAGNINISVIGAEYRYHNLFLEFLREKLEQSDFDKHLLNKKVAEYYLKMGDFLTAKRYAVKSGDLGIIAQTILKFYSMKTFSLDEYVEFNKLHNLQELPEEICRKMPFLYVPYIFFSYANGNIRKVCENLDKLYPMFPAIAAAHPEVMEHVNGIVMLDCRIAIKDLRSHFQKLPAITQQHIDLQSPTFTFQMPFLHRCARDFYELTDPQLKNDMVEVSKNIIKQNVNIMFTGAEAGLMMERNRLQDALAAALSLREAVNMSMTPEFVYAVYILIAEIYLQSYQKEKYAAAIKTLNNYIKDSSAEYLQKNVSAYEARTAILNGDRTAAVKWLDNYYVTEDSFDKFYKIFRNFTTARAYILLMQIDKAVYALNKIKMLAQDYDRLLDIAEADVLLSIAEWSSGKKKEAQTRLSGVLVTLQPSGFIRVIANEGKAILPILSSVMKKLQADGRHPESLTRFAKEVYLAAYEQAKHFKGLTYSRESGPVKLSSQQKLVLELLAKGYKFTQIVEETGLSLNTIRTHAKKAYLKLDANNSLDAVVRARQLGLLE